MVTAQCKGGTGCGFQAFRERKLLDEATRLKSVLPTPGQGLHFPEQWPEPPDLQQG